MRNPFFVLFWLPRMLELMEIQEDHYLQWKMKTIKIKSQKYEAARKRFAKYGVEEADLCKTNCREDT